MGIPQSSERYLRIRPYYTGDATEGDLAMEAGTSVTIRHDPYGTSYLGWSLEGRTGTVVRTERGDGGTIYYVRMDGEDGVTLPFRGVHLKEKG